MKERWYECLGDTLSYQAIAVMSFSKVYLEMSADCTIQTTHTLPLPKATDSLTHHTTLFLCGILTVNLLQAFHTMLYIYIEQFHYIQIILHAVSCCWAIQGLCNSAPSKRVEIEGAIIPNIEKIKTQAAYSMHWISTEVAVNNKEVFFGLIVQPYRGPDYVMSAIVAW